MSGKNLTIILPGKIGDIIICLPIAKYYHDQGYEIHWPIYEQLLTNFIQGHIDYVNFVPVSFITAIRDSKRIANELGGVALDLSFTAHGCWDNDNTKQFLNQRELTFDEFRYKLARVSIDEKWRLDIERNPLREQALFQKVVKGEDFIIFQDQASDTKVNFQLDLTGRDYQVIKLTPITNCIFDWLKLLESAKKLVLVESCFSNLVDQMKIETSKILLMKKGYYREALNGRNLHLGTPILRGFWDII